MIYMHDEPPAPGVSQEKIGGEHLGTRFSPFELILSFGDINTLYQALIMSLSY
jgi:hypothetical protein